MSKVEQPRTYGRTINDILARLRRLEARPPGGGATMGAAAVEAAPLQPTSYPVPVPEQSYAVTPDSLPTALCTVWLPPGAGAVRALLSVTASADVDGQVWLLGPDGAPLRDAATGEAMRPVTASPDPAPTGWVSVPDGEWPSVTLSAIRTGGGAGTLSVRLLLLLAR